MTIAAIATANAAGGIGIVRISGSKAFEFADKLFVGKQSVLQMASHTIHLGKISHKNKIIDSVLLSVFKAPNSFTGEDTVEINCHGGIYVCRMVLDAVIDCGARPAEPGEFTKRAFLNGKMDLSQAEAVADIITAATSNEVIVAANQLDRKLSDEIAKVRVGLIDAMGHLLASIDFSEEDVPELRYDELNEKIKDAKAVVNKLLSTADDGRIIKDGVKVAIVGAPNVGKSSLLNAISGEDKAIVTEIAGTTRDVLESLVSIRGCKLNLLDTAGIRDSQDIVEQLGVERSKNAIKNADIIFFITDGSKPINEQDQAVISLLDLSKTVCIINKSDLPGAELDLPRFEKTVKISAKMGYGLDELFEYISEKFKVGELTQKVVITNPRHRESLITSKRLLDEVLCDMAKDVPFDIVLGDIELAISALGEISGMTVSDEIIDNIFAKFCVGK